MTKYKTAESVRRGHPDKLCDLITDSILDECLRHDRYSRCACEVMATKGKIFVCGEITCAAKINIRSVVREVLRKVGYNPMKFIVFVYVHRQSADIAGGVDSALEVRNSGSEDVFASTGAGDQGTVYGYATRETWTRLPVPVVFANEICKGLDDAMHDGTIRGIGPDGKAQVTVAYEDGKPVGAKNIVVSAQHDADKDLEELRREIISEVLYPILDRFDFPKDVEILINPSGRFVEGGPAADTGEMQKAIEMLSSVKDSIINAYEIKTGLSRAKLSHLMDAETWMDAGKAVELGFADEVMTRPAETEDMEPPTVTMLYSKAAVVNSLMDKIAEKCKTNRPAPKAEPKGRSLDDLYERLNLLKH